MKHSILKKGTALLCICSVGILCTGADRLLAEVVPFERQPSFYQVVSGQLNALDPRDGVYTKIGANNESYNAAGYNIKDDFVYAWGRYAPYKDQLVRIHGDGSFQSLGTPTTTGEEVPTYRIYAGDMDLDGHLWVRGDRFYSPDLMKINVEDSTYEMVAFSGPNPGGVADIVYQEVDGNGYFFGARNQDLYVWDLVASTVQRIPVKNLPDGRIAYGAAYTDLNGNFFVSSNKGGVYQILNHTTDSPRAVFLLDSVVTGNNDGFSCPAAESPLVVPANQAPTITVEDGDVTIGGTRRCTIDLGIQDEGLPLVGDGLAVEWTHQAGPRTISFSDAASGRTEMYFSINGQYVARCNASDGELSVSEDFFITVVDDKVKLVETYSRSEDDYKYSRRLWSKLKEQLHCRKNGTLLEEAKRGFYAEDFLLAEDSEVIITAIYDGGSYRNTLFWYSDDAPDEMTKIWHSYVLGPNAPLKPGSRASLGVLPAGTPLRFGLVVDGARGGETMVFQNSNRNPEGIEQCAARMFGPEYDGPLVLAFEDQVNGDQDFNDVIFQIEIIPRYRGVAQYDDVLPGSSGIFSDRGRRGVERHLSYMGMNVPSLETLGQVFKLPVETITFEFIEDRSSMKFDLCVFDYDLVSHLDPNSLEFRTRVAKLAISVLDDRDVNPGDTVSFNPGEYGLAGKVVGLMLVPNNRRDVFLRNPHRYTAKGHGERTKRQPLFSLVGANPGFRDQMLTVTNGTTTVLCIEDHTRHEQLDAPELGEVSDSSFDDAIIVIKGALEEVSLFDNLYGLPTADPTIDFEGEDGIIPREGVICY